MAEADWWTILDDQMASQEPHRAARRSIAINYPTDLYAYVLEAARLRGISMTAYQRRASLAFAAHDLGFDWLEAMLSEPPVGSFDSPGKGVKSDGIGFGPWRIDALGDHADIEDEDAEGD